MEKTIPQGNGLVRVMETSRTPHKPLRGLSASSTTPTHRARLGPAVHKATDNVTALRDALQPLHPKEAVREVVHYLANRNSVVGCPMRLIQDEYHRFLGAKDIIEQDTSRSPAERSAATTVLWHSETHRDDNSERQQSTSSPSVRLGAPAHQSSVSGKPSPVEAVYVMDEASSSLKDVHTQLMQLHEAYRLLSSTSVARDKKLVAVEAELALERQKISVLQRGITSTHVVHASAVEDADLLRETQILSTQLAEQVAAFEDHLESGGGFLAISELHGAVNSLTHEKETLVLQCSLLAEKLLESDVVVTSLRAELSAKSRALEDAQSTIEKLKNEVRSLKDEVTHAVYGGAPSSPTIAAATF